MQALDVKCPKCGAEPGAKCRNYLGKGQAPHRERNQRVDPQAADLKRAAQKADRKNRRARDAVPLFADQVEQTTAAAEYWHTRRVRAAMAEHLAEVAAGHLMDAIAVALLRRTAAEVIGPDWTAKLDAYARRVYSPGYWLGFWTRCLTTAERVSVRLDRLVYCGPFRFELRPGEWHYSAEKVQLIDAEVWPPEGWQPPLTRAQVDALLAIPEPRQPAGVVDPLGLAEAAA